MRYLNWLGRLIVFLVLLGFAVKNDQPVTLRYFFDTEWRTSLVLVLLLFFAAGVAMGVLAMFVGMLRQRREISALKRTVGSQVAGMEQNKSVALSSSSMQ